MDQITRIKMMEEKLEAVTAAIHALSSSLEGYEEVLVDIEVLDRYLASEEWCEDFRADESGALPADLKRGVLSEDGIYNILEENRELLQRLFELGKGS